MCFVYMQMSHAVAHAFFDTFNRITCAVAMQACVVLGWQMDQTRFTRIFFLAIHLRVIASMPL